jgi:hypothetical protein
LTGTVVENLELVDHVAGVLGSVLKGLVSMIANTTMTNVYLRPWRSGARTARKRGPQQVPSRASWQERTRGGWGEPRPRSRKRSSWLVLMLDGDALGALKATYRTG